MKNIALLLLLATGIAGCGMDSSSERPAVANSDDSEQAGQSVEGQVLAGDGLGVYFEVAGDADTALVFVHGWACNRRFWREQLDVFADDYRVVALDLGGHGESGSERDRFSLSSLAGDVQSVVEHLDLPRVVLVGHSMGGPVSLEAARRMPDRVVAVVGVDTLHDASATFTADQVEPFARSFEADFDGALSAMFEGMSGAGLAPDLRDWIVTEAARTPMRVATDLLRDYPNINLAKMLGAAGVPVRVINAAAGGAIPVTEVDGNSQFADFQALIMPGVGHFLQLEDPLAFNRHLRTVLVEFNPG